MEWVWRDQLLSWSTYRYKSLLIRNATALYYICFDVLPELCCGEEDAAAATTRIPEIVAVAIRSILADCLEEPSGAPSELNVPDDVREDDTIRLDEGAVVGTAADCVWVRSDWWCAWPRRWCAERPAKETACSAGSQRMSHCNDKDTIHNDRGEAQ